MIFILGFKQGLDGNRTKLGRLKVTNIENNIVALSDMFYKFGYNK